MSDSTIKRTDLSLLKTVIFDFDGTLTCPHAIDYAAIREEIGCPRDYPILEYIESIESSARKKRAQMILEDFEMQAATVSKPNIGAELLLSFLKRSGIKIAIISRNGLGPIKRAMENFAHFPMETVDTIISRDENIAQKPSPECVNLALKRLNTEKSNAIFVGDFRIDIEAGNAADVMTVLLTNGEKAVQDASWGATVVIDCLSELRPLVDFAIPLKGGKLPNRFLDLFLNETSQIDSSLMVTPAVGEDTAAIDVTKEDIVVLKSDPITFETASAGYYAIHVNANDISTSGATPKWFLSTLLFPPGSTPATILTVMRDVRSVCHQMGITLCGGHTEITDAVTRPVISGTLIGTVATESLIAKTSIQPGDHILLTKQAGIEGTSIIASEHGERLIREGWDKQEIDEARQLKNQISVVPEARLAAATGFVSGMHDVTEGGVATALTELTGENRFGAHVQINEIPILPITKKLCDHFGIDPFGLIGSGSLLICVRPEGADRVITAILTQKIPVVRIGIIVDNDKGVTASQNNESVTWPIFDADELVRLHEAVNQRHP